ncbi:uncharacterized protein LOC130655883 [Hydractinia symbiolongicarpus]|uniref:uncharacterized protein LOC130655883 n=1 Tax=Hydractinia symbiolongicarpus TaxID=13093 RepID=UPI00254B77E5|nr:uncharacterized protein LOC130655883 [Hydractinia symbiolongicarpus]
MMEDKVTVDLDMALAWSVSAKNSLKNVNGYSQNQLVFGFNPNLPNCDNAKLPALEGKTSSEIVATNLNAMNAARKTFIQSESAEKVRRALRHQTRTSGDDRFETGDKVFYKRNTSNAWKGPGSVIGQDDKQVLIKHGSSYVRVHPCRIQRDTGFSLIDATPIESCRNKPITSLTDTDNPVNEEVVGDGDSDDSAENSDIDLQNFQSDEPERRDAIRKERQVASDEINDINNLTNSISRLSLDVTNSDTQDQKWFDGSVKPKAKSFVKYKFKDCDTVKDVEIISKGGKATGKYKSYLNIQDVDSNSLSCVDWEEIESWQPINTEEALLSQVKFADSDVLNAKIDEKVYENVENHGQKALSVRWVVTEKILNGKKKMKARLVARGFEEIDNDILKDSPTCSKESLRLILTLIAYNNWRCSSIDIKSAFLQGKEIERTVYLKPPKEADNGNSLWKLKKCIYGLVDASRCWYLRVKEELINLNVSVSKSDPAIFYWHHGQQLSGVMATHVDDFCWGGNEDFIENVIEPLQRVFLVGSECSTVFPYLGLSLNQHSDFTIQINQNAYVEEIEPIEIEKERMGKKNYPLNENEIREFRALIGRLCWLSRQTRPDIKSVN